MTRTWMRHGLCCSLMALAATVLLVSAGTGAQANEDGLGGLFQRLFSPEPEAQAVQPAPQTAFTQQRRLPIWRQYYGQRYGQRPEGTRLRPNLRYASLPKPQAEPLKIRISDRQVPLDMSDGPAAAFLKDKTLQPGDIVVLKEGARVFTGHPDKPHSIKDFVSIGRSDFIDRRTRHLLTAMMVPIGAMTAEEARKRTAAMTRLPSLASTPVLVQTAGMRVVYPGATTP